MLVRLSVALVLLVACSSSSPPVIERIEPSSGVVGTRITLSGSSFGDAEVLFGETQAVVRERSETRLVVVAPPSAPGARSVSVVRSDGERATASDAFTYEARGRPGCRTLAETRPTGCTAAPVRFELDPGAVGRGGAQQAQVAGEFTSWGGSPVSMTRSGSKFVADVPLVPGRYEYKFIVDGEWFADPAAPTEPIFGNSVKSVSDACLPSVELLAPALGAVAGDQVSVRARVLPGRDRSIEKTEVVLCIDDEERAFELGGDGLLSASLALPEGSHRLSLQARDSGGFVSSTAWTLFTTDANDEPPVADAGTVQFVRSGSQVMLDGAGSYDPDERPLTAWRWKLVSGPATFDAAGLPEGRVALAEGYRKDGHNDDPEAMPALTPARKVFTANVVGTYVFELEVEDDAGQKATSRTQVVTLPATGPRPRVSLTINGHTVDASGSERGERATFKWLTDARNPAEVKLSDWLRDDGAKLEVPEGVLEDGTWRFWVWIESDGGASWPGAVQVDVKGGWIASITDFMLAPAWSYEGAIYEIFVRRFQDSNGDGIGDLKGVTQRLDYLKGLGMKTLWLMPVFASNDRDHGYHTIDYGRIEPALGTREDLLELVREAHARDMRIVLDLVINHTSRRHPFFDASVRAFRGEGTQAEARFRDWFIWFDNNRPDLLGKFGYGRELGGERLTVQSGWAEIPDVNFANAEARRHFFDVTTYWLDPNRDGDPSDGIDGWRLDHVTGPAHVVWNALRSEVKRVNPEALLIAEIFRDFDNGGRGYGIKDYYRGEVDAAFTFPLYWDFEGIFANGDAPARLRTTLEALESDRFPKGALHSSFIENHDVPTGTTAFARYGEAKLKAALTLIAGLPPVPQVIWGQELGLSTWRGQVPWERETPQNGLLSHFRDVMTKRRDSLPLRQGAFAWVETGDASVVAFTRTFGEEKVLVVVNTSGSSRTVTLRLPQPLELTLGPYESAITEPEA